MPDDMPIEGPLGIWPFPILNALAMSGSESNNVEVVEVIRDDDGRIKSIEKHKQ